MLRFNTDTAGAGGTAGVTALCMLATQWNGASGGVTNYAFYIETPASATCITNASDVHTRATGTGGLASPLTYAGNEPATITSDAMCCPNQARCSAPLGMESGAILDSQLTDTGASDQSQKRLNGAQASGNGWIFPGPKGAIHQFGTSYYQVDLLRSMSVSGVASQGRGDRAAWVTQYKVNHNV